MNPVDVDELLPLWRMSLAATNKSRHTVEMYVLGVTQYVRWLRDHDRPVTVDRRNVEEFTAHQLKTNSAATARARQLAVRLFSKWLLDEKEIESDDLLGLVAPKLDETLVQPLTDGELKRLFQACGGVSFRDRRDSAMLRFMAETGARRSEVIDMHVDDVDLKTCVATITRGKGGRGRFAPFGDATALALGRYLRLRKTHRLADTPALWLGGGGQSFSKAGMQRVFQHRGRLAGIDRLHPHLMRHTAATRWLAAGGSEGGLMSVAGWRSHDMLDRYTRATASERAAAEFRKLNLGNV
jgi:integrase/recombinase XerD